MVFIEDGHMIVLHMIGYYFMEMEEQAQTLARKVQRLPVFDGGGC